MLMVVFLKLDPRKKIEVISKEIMKVLNFENFKLALKKLFIRLNPKFKEDQNIHYQSTNQNIVAIRNIQKSLRCQLCDL